MVRISGPYQSGKIAYVGAMKRIFIAFWLMIAPLAAAAEPTHEALTPVEVELHLVAKHPGPSDLDALARARREGLQIAFLSL